VGPSITARTPLVVWFVAGSCMTTSAALLALGLQRSQGLNLYGATWGLLSRLRTAKDTPDGTKLSGKVEVDEVLTGEPRVKRLGARSSWRWPPNTALARHLWPPGPGHFLAFVLPNPLSSASWPLKSHEISWGCTCATPHS
jgi:hypothetical protein